MRASARRACTALQVDRSLYASKSKRGGQADLKQRIKEICETRVRYGYRRVHILLQRDGWPVNPTPRHVDRQVFVGANYNL